MVNSQKLKIGKNNENIQIVHTDMAEDLVEYTIACLMKASKRHAKGDLLNFTDVAKVVKTEFDTKFPHTCWHCIVGKNFGSFVTNERGKYVLLKICVK